MKRLLLLAVPLLATAACDRGGTGNAAGNFADTSAQEGDINQALGGDELSPIPEAEDDMIANDAGLGNAAGNAAAPQPPVQPLPAPLDPPPQGR